MPITLGAPEDFDAFEQAEVARLIAEDQAAEGNAEDAGTPPPPPPPAPATAPTPQAAPTPPAGTPPAAAPTPADSSASQAGGDVRAALRASRFAERAAKERADQLNAELERLRAAAPPPSPTLDTGLTEEELRELQADIPAVGKLAEHVRKLSQDLATARAAAAATAPAPSPSFTPPIQADPDVQGAIDENADALAWQHNPDQTGWGLLVGQENLLQKHPVWGVKSLPERLAEAARRVKADLGTSSAPPPPDAAAIAAAAAAAARGGVVHTLSDVTGGGAPKTEQPGLPQFMKMSDDEILASLDRGG